MIIGGLAGHPLNRPSGTFSPTGEKAGMRGHTDDSPFLIGNWYKAVHGAGPVAAMTGRKPVGELK